MQADEYTAIFSKDNLDWINEITESDYCQLPDLIQQKNLFCSKCNSAGNPGRSIGRIYNGTKVRNKFKFLSHNLLIINALNLQYEKDEFDFSLSYVATIYASGTNGKNLDHISK